MSESHSAANSQTRGDQGVGPAEIQQLTAFSRHLSSNQLAASRVKSCENPEEIIAVALELGFATSVEALRLHVWDLQGDHWPWSGQAGRWRLRFFNQGDD